MVRDKHRSDGWRVGQRVCRRDYSQMFGTIIQAESTKGKIKVKWDDGGTSYFKRDEPSNVELVDQL